MRLTAEQQELLRDPRVRWLAGAYLKEGRVKGMTQGYRVGYDEGHAVGREEGEVAGFRLRRLAQEKARCTPRRKVDVAAHRLLEDLARGPRPATEVRDALLAGGVGARTIDTAKGSLGVVSRRLEGRWWWELPEPE